MPPLDRFMSLVRKLEVGEDECWIFDADAFRVSDGLITTPARYIYEQAAGEKLVETDELFRTCKTSRCCRPSHQERRSIDEIFDRNLNRFHSQSSTNA
jgi:hypothetical protein